MERVVTPASLLRKPAAGRPLVLAVESLIRRSRPMDATRAASVLGGSSWLVRVWKRMALRTRAVSRAVQNAIDAALSLPKTAYAKASLAIARAGVFRSVSMSFRF